MLIISINFNTNEYFSFYLTKILAWSIFRKETNKIENLNTFLMYFLLNMVYSIL